VPLTVQPREDRASELTGNLSLAVCLTYPRWLVKGS
jgi:hypothetical protein